jgi:hypothetical protein
MPEEAQGAGHAADSSWTREKVEGAVGGSCEVSGTESHIITRCVELVELTAIHTFGGRVSDCSASGVDGAFTATGAAGIAVNAAWPEYSGPLYIARPGSCATLSGSATPEPLPLVVVEFLNPGEDAREAEGEVRRVWRSWGLVVDVYWPGRRRAEEEEGADIVTPTGSDVRQEMRENWQHTH